MSIIIRLKKLFKRDYYEDFHWLEVEVSYKNLQEDTYIKGTQIITGRSNCDIILEDRAKLEIRGDFKGKVIGLGNNIIRIRGNFEGLVSGYKLVFYREGKFKGKAYFYQFLIEEGMVLDGEVRGLELVPYTILPNKINFEYMKSITY